LQQTSELAAAKKELEEANAGLKSAKQVLLDARCRLL
jgi:hypothetical protein